MIKESNFYPSLHTSSYPDFKLSEQFVYPRRNIRTRLYLNSMSLAARHSQLIGIPAVPAVGRLIGKELTLEAEVLRRQSLALSLGVR